MTRNMALKEAFEYLYKQSQDTDLEKTIIKYRFNESKIEESKRKLSEIDITPNKDRPGEHMSWNPKIYIRHKNKSSQDQQRSQIQLPKHPTKKLQEIIDKLHFSNFVHTTENPAKFLLGKGCHKRKDGSLIFLARNIRRVKVFLHLPLVGKEKQNIFTPRKNEKFLCRGSTISKRKTKCSGLQRSKRVSTREHSNVKTFDSGFYEILEVPDDDDDSEAKLSPQTKRSCVEQLDSPEIHPQRPIGSAVKSTIIYHEHNVNKSSQIRSKSVLKDKCESYGERDGSDEKSIGKSKVARSRKSKEIVFKPLFSSHCGGTWRQIVDEN